MNNINGYLSSVYNECVYDGVSTCRFFFTEENNVEETLRSAIDFFNTYPRFVKLVIPRGFNFMHEWKDFVKYFLKNMEYVDNERKTSIKAFSNIVYNLTKDSGKLKDIKLPSKSL